MQRFNSDWGVTESPTGRFVRYDDAEKAIKLMDEANDHWRTMYEDADVHSNWWENQTTEWMDRCKSTMNKLVISVLINVALFVGLIWSLMP